MIKSHKIILALMVLIVIVANILVEAQGIIPTSPAKDPLKDPAKDPSPKDPPTDPPIDPPPKDPKDPKTPPLDPPKDPKTPTLPPSLPPPPKTTNTTPPPLISPTETAPLFPPKSTDITPPPLSTPPIAFPPKQPDPSSPLPSFTTPASPSSQSPIPQLCTTSNGCDITKFCNQGKCQPRGSLDDKCFSRDGCLSQFICNKGICQYRDSGPKTNHSYDVKKAAITGGIIVGVFAVSGFIFVIYRNFKRRNEHKARELTSSIYSADGTGEFDPIYPFSERSNSFSNSKPTPPSHVPTKNHYDPLPPTGNTGFVGGPGPRQGYYNYYNNDYNDYNDYSGGNYMIQNENERTINLLQQTRGNVMIAPHIPHAQHPPHPQPHLQQNYNWNYGVPGVPAQQQLMMDQGGLFPVPSVKRQYGGHIPNNTNNDIKNNLNKKKKNNNDSSLNSNSNENSGDKQKKTQNLRDLLQSESAESIPSNTSENYKNVESIYDSYARESVFKPKTLEVKLSQETNNTKDSKPITGRTRSRTFGHTDSPKPKSSTVEESKGLNGINEYGKI